MVKDRIKRNSLNMDCLKILSIAISLLLTIDIVNSQNAFPGIVPNPDYLYFADDRQRLPQPLASQPQPLAIQPQPLAIPPQPLTIPPQPLAIQPQLANTVNQQVIGQQFPTNQINLQATSDGDIQARNTDVIRSREIIRLDETATALTNFSINLMKQVIQQSQGNTVVSPYSIATVLALIQQGATGVTLDQLTTALQMSPQTSAASYKTRTDDVQKRNSRNILRTANNIFLANGFSLNPAFRATALRDFRTDVTPTNFAAAAQTAKEINSWVAASTDNKIQNLLSPDSLSPNTQMILVNAIYFKGLWEIPFRRQATTPGEFHLRNRTAKKAQYMHTRRFFKTGVDPYTGAKVIVLPFEREEYSLMIILPHSLVTVTDTLSTLTVSQLEDYLNFPHLETDLELPRFSIKADTNLRTVLQQLGISKIFGNAELSNIGTYQDTKSPQVSEAVHSAALTIDEEGGSASAATAFSVVALSNDSPSVVFKANRPFLAVIWDGRTKLPLFVANIEDPTV